METKEVFGIEVVHNVDGLEVLDNESVVIDDVQYPVFRSDEAGPDDFFYN